MVIKSIEPVFFSEISTREIVNKEFLMIITDTMPCCLFRA